jgi:hypothetical protein
VIIPFDDPIDLLRDAPIGDRESFLYKDVTSTKQSIQAPTPNVVPWLEGRQSGGTVQTALHAAARGHRAAAASPRWPPPGLPSFFADQPLSPPWTVGVQNGTGLETSCVCWAEHHLPSRRKVSAVRGIALNPVAGQGPELAGLRQKREREAKRLATRVRQLEVAEDRLMEGLYAGLPIERFKAEQAPDRSADP